MRTPRRSIPDATALLRTSPRRRGHAVTVKPASAHALPADGMRVLVGRRWPPGLSRERVAADLWLKDAAPTDALVRACATDRVRWDEFQAKYQAKYQAELATRADVLRLVDELRQRGPVTLLHAGGDRARNIAVALVKILEDCYAERRRTTMGEQSW